MKRFFLCFCFVATATGAMAETCVVEDPTGTPLNVRSSPNGSIRGALHNGVLVEILDTAYVQGNRWVYVAPLEGGKRGWVYGPHLDCDR